MITGAVNPGKNGFILDLVQVCDHIEHTAVLVVGDALGHCLEDLATEVPPTSTAHTVRFLLGKAIVRAVAVNRVICGCATEQLLRGAAVATVAV